MDSRRTFVTKVAVALGSSAALQLNAQEQSQRGFYRQLVKSNDDLVPNVIRELSSPRPQRSNIRRVGEHVETLAASFCAPDSSLFKSTELISPMEAAAKNFVSAQHPDCTVVSGKLKFQP